MNGRGVTLCTTVTSRCMLSHHHHHAVNYAHCAICTTCTNVHFNKCSSFHLKRQQEHKLQTVRSTYHRCNLCGLQHPNTNSARTQPIALLHLSCSYTVPSTCFWLRCPYTLHLLYSYIACTVVNIYLLMSITCTECSAMNMTG